MTRALVAVSVSMSLSMSLPAGFAAPSPAAPSPPPPAAPPNDAAVAAVHVNLDEARACLPLANGALVGTAGGLVRIDDRGQVRGVWTATSGLPGTRIETIARAGDQLWIGTDAGAARVTLANDVLTIAQVAGDRGVRDVVRFGGKTYLATRGGGVRIVGGGAVAFRVASKQPARMDVTALAVAGGNLYAGTMAGLFRMTNGSLVGVVDDALPKGAPITALLGDGAQLYIGTSGGLVLREGERGKLVGAGDIRRISKLGSAVVVARMGEGLARVDRGRLVSFDGAPREVLMAQALGVAASAGAASAGAAGAASGRAASAGAWSAGASSAGASAGAWSAGAASAGASSAGASANPSATSASTSAAASSAGSASAASPPDTAICAGTIDGAWLRSSADKPWVRMARRAGPPSNDISALAVDGDRLWVGTFDRGLAVRERGAWRSLPDTLDRRINALHVERPRAGQPARVWVATASGLFSVTDGDVSRLARADGLPSRSVLALGGMRDGRLLVGTSSGAVIIGSGRPVRLVKGQDIGNVWAVAEDATGALWLGTTTGLYRGSETSNDWQRFSMATGHLRDDWVTALAVFPAATDKVAMLVGTYHGGITRIDIATAATVGDAAATATAMQLGDGWVNPAGITVDGDRVLVSTMDGLLAGDGRSNAWTQRARLPGKDVTAAARVGRTLFVATRRGLAELR